MFIEKKNQNMLECIKKIYFLNLTALFIIYKMLFINKMSLEYALKNYETMKYAIIIDY